VKLSVIVGTRNRAGSIIPCLDSIAAACATADTAAEIVVVDNGSKDETPALVRQWTRASPLPVQLLSEPQPGLARAHNQALSAARGELLVITDDDCRLHPEYVNDLLRHDREDGEHIVLRGGRIELGDPADLPLTINTAPSRQRWTRSMHSARDQRIGGCLNGCNLTMRRRVIERIGGFDEGFGPGSYIGSGADTDFIYRAYLAGISLEYVPDMVVFHHHGRRSIADGHQVIRRYTIANGALFVRYFSKDRDLCRIFYGDLREAALGILRRRNTQSPRELFTNHELLAAAVLGALRYIILRHRRRFRFIESAARPVGLVARGAALEQSR
jgi:GT2 family glycosyltransferase